MNFKAKFGIKEVSSEIESSIADEAVTEFEPKMEEIPTPENSPPQPQRSWTRSRFFCAKCKTSITEKVAIFCFNNKKKFGGKAYCFDCQNQI
jgi:hypothetical protein